MKKYVQTELNLSFTWLKIFQFQLEKNCDKFFNQLTPYYSSILVSSISKFQRIQHSYRQFLHWQPAYCNLLLHLDLRAAMLCETQIHMVKENTTKYFIRGKKITWQRARKWFWLDMSSSLNFAMHNPQKYYRVLFCEKVRASNPFWTRWRHKVFAPGIWIQRNRTYLRTPSQA